jgi:predicted RNase H-like nuclease (RuvC/YqgF family)
VSAITIINKLEKQLNNEKSEREKMRSEIEELRKMNEKLCNVIVQS